MLAEETAKIHSVPDEEDCEDLFLSCNDLEEDETVIEHCDFPLVNLFYCYSVPGSSTHSAV